MDNDNVSGGSQYCGANCRALALILLVTYQGDSFIFICQSLQDVSAAIGATVVYDNQFEAANQSMLKRQYPAQTRFDNVSFTSNHVVVPEPGTAALVSLGLVLLARRRRSE